MAVVTTYGVMNFIFNSHPLYDSYPLVGNGLFSDNGWPRDFYLSSEPKYVTVTNNLPIDVEPRLTITSKKQTSFYDDYYNRIHVNPSKLDMGNMLSSQIQNVEVWSAYSVNKLLSSIDQQNTDGILITEPAAAPTIFKPMESRIYTFNISTNGPPLLDADYTFNFPSEPSLLQVIGRRVVIWPFIPETGAEEVMQWKTDILGSFNNEQRIALREAPRQSLSYEFLLDNSQFSRAKAIATQWAHRVYGIAVWSEISKVESTLPIGTTFVPFDTSNSDYRDNDLILMWSSDSVVEALEITTVLGNGVNLKLPLSSTWSNFYVAPLRFARALSGIEFSRTSNKYIGASARFEITTNKDLGNEGTFPTYRGKVVLMDRSAIVGGITERIARSVDTFDNGSGPIEIDIQTNWVRHLQGIAFVKNTKASIWNLRRWIHARRGRQKSFWLPSWNLDIEIVQSVSTSTTTLTILPINYSLFYSVKDILILLKNGTVIFLRAMSATVDTSDNELLALSTPVGYTFDPTDIELSCFMSHCRLDTDQITFKHINHNLIESSIVVMETPE